MTDSPPAEPPIAIDRVQRARGVGDQVRLRVSGHWLGPDQPQEHEPLLVIQLQGRRHRFPASSDPAGGESLPGRWHAEFMIPSWAVPSRSGQAAVWVGDAVVAVGPPGSSADTEPPSGPAVVAEQLPPPSAQTPPAPAPTPTPTPDADAGRGGPLADLLFKETVSALHAELERRSAEAARLRGALADARSELDARTAGQTGLETAHSELRHELEQLMTAVGRQREDFEERLAAAHEQLERAREEAAMAAAGRDEAESELTRARQQTGSLQERLAAQAEAGRRGAQEAGGLREQLAAAQVSRDAAISEAGGLRAELERLGAELTVMREQVSAQGGDLGEAQRLLAGARALTEELRVHAGA